MVVARGAGERQMGDGGEPVGVGGAGGLEAFAWQSKPEYRDALNAYDVASSTAARR